MDKIDDALKKTKHMFGIVKNTGFPIDGHKIYLTQWAWDNFESYHVTGTEKGDEAAQLALIKTFHQKDELYADKPFEEFKRLYDADEYDPPGVFCIDLDKADIVEVLEG